MSAPGVLVLVIGRNVSSGKYEVSLLRGPHGVSLTSLAKKLRFTDFPEVGGSDLHQVRESL